MKLETLVKRFQTSGYVPKGLSRDEECQSIMKWLYEEHNIFVSANYMQLNFHTKPPSYRKFCGSYRYFCGKDYSEVYYGKLHFDNPYDAYFDALRHMLPAFKFQAQFNKTK